MAQNPTPTEINYKTSARLLTVTFGDGSQFELPAEYLRVYSPSAEVRGHGPGQEVLQVGKEQVGIEKIEPVGNYAVCLHFDDGHNSGIYSWKELHRLGSNREDFWAHYLERLDDAGHRRGGSA